MLLVEIYLETMCNIRGVISLGHRVKKKVNITANILVL